MGEPKFRLRVRSEQAYTAAQLTISCRHSCRTLLSDSSNRISLPQSSVVFRDFLCVLSCPVYPAVFSFGDTLKIANVVFPISSTITVFLSVVS